MQWCHSQRVVVVDENYAYWGTPDNRPPPDVPACGLHNELCPPDYTGTAGIGVAERGGAGQAGLGQGRVGQGEVGWGRWGRQAGQGGVGQGGVEWSVAGWGRASQSRMGGAG